jgi:DNA-binding transcriptional LysR family regulator
MRGAEFAELGAFVAVAERASFARAAAYLGIAPSTLSHNIRMLEERLGVRLFNRTTRSVALTEAGEKLLSRVRPAFADLDEAVEAVNDFRESVSGNLRISVSTVPGHMIMAPILKGFLDRYPAITLEVAIDDTASDIVSGRFDAGIRYSNRIERDMVALKVGPDFRVIAAAAPSYLARRPKPLTPHDLQHHNCIRYRKDEQIMPWAFEKDGESVEVAVGGSLIVNSPELLMRALLEGIGIGYTADAFVRAHIDSGELVPLLADWSRPNHCYQIYYPGRRHMTMPLRLFIDYLRDFTAQSAAAPAIPAAARPPQPAPLG